MKNLILLAALPFASGVHATQADVIEALDKHQTALAAKAFAQLSNTEQSAVQGQLLKSRVLFQQNQTKDAYNLLEPLVTDKTRDVDLLYHFGKSAMRMAQKANLFSKLRYAKAGLKAWHQGLLIEPKHADTLDGLIRFHLKAPKAGGGDINEALKYAQVLKPINPEQGYSHLVEIYDKKEQPQQANKLMAQGMAELPKNYQLYFDRGVKYAALKNGELARKDWLQAAANATTPDSKREALYQLGKYSDESGEALKVGIDALEQLLAFESPTSIGWMENWSKYRLAGLYIKNDQPTQAKKLMSEIDLSSDRELRKRVKKLKRQL